MIFKPKGSKNYHYEFMFNNKRIRRSTKQKNDRVARQMEAAAKTKLAKAEVGIEENKERPGSWKTDRFGGGRSRHRRRPGGTWCDCNLACRVPTPDAYREYRLAAVSLALSLKEHRKAAERAMVEGVLHENAHSSSGKSRLF